MNIATIVPLWPGNVGLVQAAVALPLAQLRRAVRDRLRLRPRAAGDRDGVRRSGSGCIAIAREGISFAMLRRMEDDQESSENAVEEVQELVEELDGENEPEAAREGAAVSR